MSFWRMRTRPLSRIVSPGRCLALLFGKVAPSVIDGEAPHRNGGKIAIVRKNEGVISVGGTEVAVFRLAGKRGEAIDTDGALMERAGIFTEEGKLHAGKGFAGLAGIGVEEGGVAGQLPGETDIGELDERLSNFLRGLGEIRVVGRISGDREEEGSGLLVGREKLIPLDLVRVCRVEGCVDGNNFIKDGGAGDELEGEIVSVSDAVVVRPISGVAAVSLGDADEFLGREFFDAEVE